MQSKHILSLPKQIQTCNSVLQKTRRERLDVGSNVSMQQHISRRKTGTCSRRRPPSCGTCGIHLPLADQAFSNGSFLVDNWKLLRRAAGIRGNAPLHPCTCGHRCEIRRSQSCRTVRRVRLQGSPPSCSFWFHRDR